MKKRHLAILALVLFLWVVVQLGSSHSSGSSFSYSGDGSRAFFLLLRQMNIPVKPWTSPLTELPGQGDSIDTTAVNNHDKSSGSDSSVLFVVSPSSFNQAEDLLRWVKRGNTLVLISPENGAFNHLLNELNLGLPQLSDQAISLSLNRWSTTHLAVDCPHEIPACKNVTQISKMRRSFRYYDSSWTPVVEGDDATEAFVLKRTLGDDKKNIPILSDLPAPATTPTVGTVWAFAGSEIIQNDEIDRFDNLRFLYQIATSSKQVLFDEFHHGFFEATTEQLKATEHAIWMFSSYAFLLLLLAAISRMIRLGPSEPERSIDTASTSDLARVVGMIYKERNLNHLLGHYFDAWKRRLEQVSGIGRDLSLDELLSELNRRMILTPDENREVEIALMSLQQVARGQDNSVHRGQKPREKAVLVLESVLKKLKKENI